MFVVRLVPLEVGKVYFEKGFWYNKFQVLKEWIIPYQWQVLNDPEKSHAVHNFKIAAGDIDGSFRGRPVRPRTARRWAC